VDPLVLQVILDATRFHPGMGDIVKGLTRMSTATERLNTAYQIMAKSADEGTRSLAAHATAFRGIADEASLATRQIKGMTAAMSEVGRRQLSDINARKKMIEDMSRETRKVSDMAAKMGVSGEAGWASRRVLAGMTAAGQAQAGGGMPFMQKLQLDAARRAIRRDAEEQAVARQNRAQLHSLQLGAANRAIRRDIEEQARLRAQPPTWFQRLQGFGAGAAGVGGKIVGGVETGLGKVGSLFGMGTAFAAALTIVNSLENALSKVYHLVKSTVEEAVKLGAEFERTRVAFEVMAGSEAAGRGLFEGLQQLSTRMPFPLEDLTETAQFLLASGKGVNQVLPTLEKMGNIAAGDSRKLNMLAKDLERVELTGKLTQREMRTFAALGVGIKDFADALGVSVGRFQLLMHAGEVGPKAVAKVLDYLNSVQGRFHKGSERGLATVSGQWQRLENVIRLVLGRLGEEANKKMDVAKWIGLKTDLIIASFEKIRKFVMAIVDRINAGLQVLYDKAIALFKKMAGGKQFNPEDLLPSIEQVSSFVSKAFDTAVTVVKELYQALKRVGEILGTIYSTLTDIAGTFSKIGMGGGSWAQVLGAAVGYRYGGIPGMLAGMAVTGPQPMGPGLSQAAGGGLSNLGPLGLAIGGAYLGKNVVAPVATKIAAARAAGGLGLGAAGRAGMAALGGPPGIAIATGSIAIEYAQEKAVESISAENKKHWDRAARAEVRFNKEVEEDRMRKLRETEKKRYEEGGPIRKTLFGTKLEEFFSPGVMEGLGGVAKKFYETVRDEVMNPDMVMKLAKSKNAFFNAMDRELFSGQAQAEVMDVALKIHKAFRAGVSPMDQFANEMLRISLASAWGELTAEETRFGRFEEFEKLSKSIGGIGTMANYLAKPAAANTQEAASIIAKAQVDASQTAQDRVVSTILAGNLQREQMLAYQQQVVASLENLPPRLRDAVNILPQGI
jgi:hypothetical protein